MNLLKMPRSACSRVFCCYRKCVTTFVLYWDCPTSWPDLVGKTFEEAYEAIKQSYQTASIQRVKEGSVVTMDYRTDRVRIYVDDQGIVVTAPTIG